jgi:two-component system response regulator CpxR
MSIVNIFAGSYCYDEKISKSLVNELGYKYITDDDILATAEEHFKISAKKLVHAMHHAPSIFNKFTHEKERSIAFIKMSLAENLKEDNIIYAGFAGYLLPSEITHVLKVCIIADVRYRISIAAKKETITKKDARRRIQKDDERLNAWSQYLFGCYPWNSSLYDMVIPIDKTTVEDATELIISNLQKDVVKTTDKSKQAMDDFILSGAGDNAYD